MNKFLIHKKGEVNNIIYSMLERKGDITTFTSEEDPKDYALLVMDAKSLDTNYFKANLKSIIGALENDIPVMILDPSEGHKKVLASYIGFSSSDRSVAYSILPGEDIHGVRNYHILEQFEYAKVNKIMCHTVNGYRNKIVDTTMPKEIDLSKIPVPELKPEHVHDFTSKLEDLITRKQEKMPLTTTVEPPSPPAHAPNAKWVYDPYFPIVIHASEHAPAGTLTINGATFIGIYLDNINVNQEFQWLLINAGGLFKADMQRDDDTQRGWAIGGFELLGPTPSDLRYISGSPNSVSGATTYSASSSFTVGVAAGTEGASENFSYTESESVSRTISDWEIAQMGEDQWNFFQQNPYNGESQTFPDGCQSDGHAAALPTISTSSLDYQTQTVWKTTYMRRDNEKLDYKFKVYGTYIYFEDTGKSWKAEFYYFPGGYSLATSWTIDFNLATWPPE